HFRRGLPGLGAHGAARRARPPRRQRRRGPRARSADGTDPLHPRRGPRPPPGPPPADLPQGPPRQGDAAPDLPHRRRDQPPPRRPCANCRGDYVLGPPTGLSQFTPGEGLGRRLDHLPQTSLKDRRVKETLRLTSRTYLAASRLRAALDDDTGTNWPDVHFLGP